MPTKVDRWRSDPVAFITDVLRDPQTGRPFALYPAQVEFVRRAFTLRPDGSLPYPELIFSAPKKSGKTGLAAMLAIYVAIVIGGRLAEVYCLSNDYEQSVGRVFEAARRIVEASPLLRDSAKVTADRIEFTSTGSFIQACASDYSGFAGANPSLCIFDELWGYVSERAQRLWDEAVPSPTRKVSGRLTVSYSGFEGESTLLESLYKKAIAGEQIASDLYESPGMLAFWTHECPAPWQTDAWREQMRQQLRPNAYLRLIENRWVSSESSFVGIDQWNRCVDSELSPILAEPSLRVWCGVDASVKHDSTAVVACTFDQTAARVRLVWHRVFQPSPDDPLDFERDIEDTLIALRRRFYLQDVRYDPYQMAATAQRLASQGLPMVEFPQTSPNLTAASQNLFELITGRNLVAYPDADMRLAIQRAVAVETPRGWRISKSLKSHKIDVVVALAQAALGAVQQGQTPTGGQFIAVPSSRSVWARQPGRKLTVGEQDALDDARASARGSDRRRKWRGF